MVVAQVIQDSRLQFAINRHRGIRFDKSVIRKYEYALLRDDSVNRITWFSNIVIRAGFGEQNDPALFIRLTAAGKEKRNEIIRGEVNQICSASVVLKLGQNFKIVNLTRVSGIHPRLAQNFLLDDFDVKVFSFDVLIRTVQTRGNFRVELRLPR